LINKLEYILLFIEAYILLGIARAVILLLPFKKVVYFMGTHGLESSFSYNENKKVVNKVARAVNRAATLTPWKSTCLAKAMVARQMLKERGISSCTIYCGVAKDENGSLTAHAWLRCGSTYVTGYENSESFTVTGVFGSE